jgi:hypothetical protein
MVGKDYVHLSVKACFAAIGVCVFRAWLRLRTFLFRRTVLWKKKILLIPFHERIMILGRRVSFSLKCRKNVRSLKTCLTKKNLLGQYDIACEKFFWHMCNRAYAQGSSEAEK